MVDMFLKLVYQAPVSIAVVWTWKPERLPSAGMPTTLLIDPQGCEIGTIAGPAFEAKLETERGSGTVRYLLTRQGLEQLGVQPPPAKPQYLN